MNNYRFWCKIRIVLLICFDVPSELWSYQVTMEDLMPGVRELRAWWERGAMATVVVMATFL